MKLTDKVFPVTHILIISMLLISSNLEFRFDVISLQAKKLPLACFVVWICW